MNLNKIPSIIIAEDDQDDAFFFREIVNELMEETELIIVENGVLMMNYLQNSIKPPDLVFLDINMPLKDGIECLKEIKNTDGLKQIKTIILSTSSDSIQIKKCYDLGADLYITKPSNYNDFKSILKNCLDKFWSK